MKKLIGALISLLLIVSVGLTLEPKQADASTTLKLTKTVKLYDSKSFNSNSPASLSPQTVQVVKTHTDGWYTVKTWLGDKYIAPNGYSLKLVHTTHLHSTPSLNGLLRDKWSTEKPISVSPQTVTVVDQKGNWYKIKTWMGDQWIAPYGVSAKQTTIEGNKYHMNHADLGILISTLESKSLAQALEYLPKKLSYMADFASFAVVKPLLPKLKEAHKAGKGAVIVKTARGAYLYRNQETTN